MQVGKTAEEGWARPMMRAGACLGWRLRREAYCRFKGDRPRCATFPPARQKEWFFTGLTSQICCIKGLVCQEPHVWVTESERTVSIMSAPHTFRLRKGTLCYEMSCTRMVDSEEVFESSVQRQINKGFIACGPNVQRVRGFLFYPTLYLCDSLVSTPFKYTHWFKNVNVCVKVATYSIDIMKSEYCFVVISTEVSMLTS